MMIMMMMKPSERDNGDIDTNGPPWGWGGGWGLEGWVGGGVGGGGGGGVGLGGGGGGGGGTLKSLGFRVASMNVGGVPTSQ